MYMYIYILINIGMETDIDKTYKLKEQIGKGSFGEIYVGINKFTREKVAIKIESIKEYKTLFHEVSVYKEFKKETGFPKLRKFGETSEFNYIVIDLLGKSLEELKEECGGTLSLKTVLLVAVQVIERLELMHMRGFIHRDIKPDNFLIGRKKHKSIIYIIDFGLTKRFRNKYTQRHNKFVSDKKLVGTPRYASVNVMSGFESSRRDDLESVGYMLIYLLKGSLPWQGLSAKTKTQKYKKIYACKNKTRIDELCESDEDIYFRIILSIVKSWHILNVQIMNI
jgi:serine/threonine protein kinase